MLFRKQRKKKKGRKLGLFSFVKLEPQSDPLLGLPQPLESEPSERDPLDILATKRTAKCS